MSAQNQSTLATGVGAGSCCSDLGVEHYGMADEIEFIENYKTHVASAVIMMQVGFLN